MLTDQEVDQFESLGFIVVRGLFDDAALEPLIQESRSAMAEILAGLGVSSVSALEQRVLTELGDVFWDAAKKESRLLKRPQLRSGG